MTRKNRSQKRFTAASRRLLCAALTLVFSLSSVPAYALRQEQPADNQAAVSGLEEFLKDPITSLTTRLLPSTPAVQPSGLEEGGSGAGEERVPSVAQKMVEAVRQRLPNQKMERLLSTTLETVLQQVADSGAMKRSSYRVNEWAVGNESYPNVLLTLVIERGTPFKERDSRFGGGLATLEIPWFVVLEPERDAGSVSVVGDPRGDPPTFVMKKGSVPGREMVVASGAEANRILGLPEEAKSEPPLLLEGFRFYEPPAGLEEGDIILPTGSGDYVGSLVSAILSEREYDRAATAVNPDISRVMGRREAAGGVVRAKHRLDRDRQVLARTLVSEYGTLELAIGRFRRLLDSQEAPIAGLLTPVLKSFEITNMTTAIQNALLAGLEETAPADPSPFLNHLQGETPYQTALEKLLAASPKTQLQFGPPIAAVRSKREMSPAQIEDFLFQMAGGDSNGSVILAEEWFKIKIFQKHSAAGLEEGEELVKQVAAEFAQRFELPAVGESTLVGYLSRQVNIPTAISSLRAANSKTIPTETQARNVLQQAQSTLANKRRASSPAGLEENEGADAGAYVDRVMGHVQSGEYQKVEFVLRVDPDYDQALIGQFTRPEPDAGYRLEVQDFPDAPGSAPAEKNIIRVYASSGVDPTIALKEVRWLLENTYSGGPDQWMVSDILRFYDTSRRRERTLRVANAKVNPYSAVAGLEEKARPIFSVPNVAAGSLSREISGNLLRPLLTDEWRWSRGRFVLDGIADVKVAITNAALRKAAHLEFSPDEIRESVEGVSPAVSAALTEVGIAANTHWDIRADADRPADSSVLNVWIELSPVAGLEESWRTGDALKNLVAAGRFARDVRIRENMEDNGTDVTFDFVQAAFVYETPGNLRAYLETLQEAERKAGSSQDNIAGVIGLLERAKKALPPSAGLEEGEELVKQVAAEFAQRFELPAVGESTLVGYLSGQVNIPTAISSLRAANPRTIPAEAQASIVLQQAQSALANKQRASSPAGLEEGIPVSVTLDQAVDLIVGGAAAGLSTFFAPLNMEYGPALLGSSAVVLALLNEAELESGYITIGRSGKRQWVDHMEPGTRRTLGQLRDDLAKMPGGSGTPPAGLEERSFSVAQAENILLNLRRQKEYGDVTTVTFMTTDSSGTYDAIGWTKGFVLPKLEDVARHSPAGKVSFHKGSYAGPGIRDFLEVRPAFVSLEQYERAEGERAHLFEFEPQEGKPGPGRIPAEPGDVFYIFIPADSSSLYGGPRSLGYLIRVMEDGTVSSLQGMATAYGLGQRAGDFIGDGTEIFDGQIRVGRSWDSSRERGATVEIDARFYTMPVSWDGGGKQLVLDYPTGYPRGIFPPFNVFLLTQKTPLAGLEEGEGWRRRFIHLVSPDGEIVAEARGNQVFLLPADAPYLNRAIVSMEGHEWPVLFLAFSDDGSKLATGSTQEESKVVVWAIPSGKQLITLDDLSGLKDVSFSKDGRQVITESNRGPTLFWDVATGRLLDPALAAPSAAGLEEGAVVERVTGLAETAGRVVSVAIQNRVLILGPGALGALRAASYIRPTDASAMPIAVVVKNAEQGEKVKAWARDLFLSVEVLDASRAPYNGSVEAALIVLKGNYVRAGLSPIVARTLADLPEIARLLGVPEPESFARQATMEAQQDLESRNL